MPAKESMPRGAPPRTVSGRDAVAAVLRDPAAIVPPVDAPGPFGTIAWLRATVSRFSNGEAHARRRALVEARIAALDGQRLRELAAAGTPPLRVLATESGVAEADADRVVEAVATVAAAYHPGTSAPGADAAVATLAELLPPAAEEELAQHIALLVQASTATATLIARGGDLTLPPVPTTRRLTPDGLVVLDLTGLPFGAGPRRCPGEAVARALVEGALR